MGNDIESQNQHFAENYIECTGGKLLSSSVCAPKFYRKEDIPNKPTVVNTSLELKNIRATNDKEMTITADIIFSFYWIDNRIKTKFSNTEKNQGRTVLDIQQLREIWKPDIYIYNLSEFNSHVVKDPLGGLSVLSSIYWEDFNANQTLTDTWIEYWFEAKVSIYCNFYYHLYPMDVQQCEFRMSSSNFGKNLIFKLTYEAVRFPTAGENALHDFDMNITFIDTSGKYKLNLIVILYLQNQEQPFSVNIFTLYNVYLKIAYTIFSLLCQRIFRRQNEGWILSESERSRLYPNYEASSTTISPQILPAMCGNCYCHTSKLLYST